MAILRVCKAMLALKNTNRRYCQYFCLDACGVFVLRLLRPKFSGYVIVREYCISNQSELFLTPYKNVIVQLKTSSTAFCLVLAHLLLK